MVRFSEVDYLAAGVKNQILVSNCFFCKLRQVVKKLKRETFNEKTANIHNHIITRLV